MKQNWRQRMMERRISRAKAQDCNSPADSFGSTDCEKSFDSCVSVSSSSGNRPTFHCDSSTEASETESYPTQVSTNKEQRYTKKEKDSKKKRFRRMITRPLRRSQSAGCEKDIPTHFLEKSTDDEDTVSTAMSSFSHHRSTFLKLFINRNSIMHLHEYTHINTLPWVTPLCGVSLRSIGEKRSFPSLSYQM